MNHIQRLSSLLGILALLGVVAVTGVDAANDGADKHDQKGQQNRRLQAVKRLNALQQGSVIMLRWQPVPGCDGYRVYHEASDELTPYSPWYYVDASQTSTRFSDVAAGGHYTFSVSGTYGKTEGPRSKPVTVIMKETRTGPSDTAK